MMQVMPRALTGVDDIALGPRVQRACRFVHDDDRRVLREHARDLHALALAAGKVVAALADPVLVAAFALHDVLVQLRVARGPYHLKIVDRVVPQADIAGDGVLKKGYLLVDDGQQSR